MDVTGNTTRDDDDSAKAEQHSANLAYRTICHNIGCNIRAELRIFRLDFPDIEPEPFYQSGFRATRLAYELLRGRDDKGGPVGKLRVLAREPLEFRRIGFNQVGLETLEAEPATQVNPDLVGFCFDTLEKHMSGIPFWGVVEYGRRKERGHFHIVVKPGTCSLGVSNGVVDDSELVEHLAYLCKPPVWSPANAIAYVARRHAEPHKRVARRFSHRNLGNSRTRTVTLQQIETALGFSIAKPESFRIQNLGRREKTLSEAPNLGRKENVGRVEQTRDVGSVETNTQPLETYAAMLDREYEMVLAAQAEAGYLWTDDEPESFDFESAWETVADSRPWGHEVNTEGLWMSEWELVGDVGIVKPSPLPTLRHSSPEITAQVREVHRAWLAGDFDGRPGRIGIGRTDDLGSALGRYFARSWLSGGEAYDLCQVEALPQIIPLHSHDLRQVVAV